MIITNFINKKLIRCSIFHKGHASKNNACPSKQYLELYKPGMIQCSFENGFNVLSWYNSTREGHYPVLTYDNFDITGTGYLSGDYNLSHDGSLLIRNVSMLNDRIYAVEKLHLLYDTEVVTHQIVVQTIGNNLFVIVNLYVREFK